MTPTEMRKVWDIEAQIERRAHRRRVLWVAGILAGGAATMVVLIELVVRFVKAVQL